MISWVVLAITAQFLSALTVFIDKYVLVSKTGIKHPAAFAFYTAMLSGVVVVLIPFGLVSLPTAEVAFLSLLSAMLYVTSLLFLYRVLQKLSVTDVIPITAAVGAIVTGVLASFFLIGDIPASFVPAFVLLVVGTFLIYCFCFPWQYLVMTILSGALVGSATFIVKLVFESAGSFGNALFWPLFMNVVVALVVLAPARFKAIKMTLKESSGGAKFLVLLSKALGGAAFFLTFLAISLGSVTIVNALGGLQLIFLLILVPLFIRRLPEVFSHEFMPGTFVLKIVGTVCVVLGLAALFLA